MFRYGLLFGVVGTIVCITVELEQRLPYKPVCGIDGKTYTHIDVLNKQNAEGTEESNVGTPEDCHNQERIRRSIDTCSTEVREVCGTDGVTYTNPCMLNQAHTPVNNVTLNYFGSCINKTLEVLTNDTNNIDDAVSSSEAKEDPPQNIKISDINSAEVAVEDDENERYVENEQTTENDNVSAVFKDKFTEAENNLDTYNDKKNENDSLSKNFAGVVQNKSNFQNGQLNMNIESEQSINNAQNTTDAKDVLQSTSEAQSENELRKSQKLNHKENQSSEGFEGNIKNGKNKSRKRRSDQNPVDTNGNEEQYQSELKQDKYKNKSKKTKTHRTGANLINPNTETASETEVGGKSEGNIYKSEKSRKPRDVQNNADSNGKFETKRAKVVSKNESKKFKHGNAKTNVKNKFDKSRKSRDVQKDNVQSKNGNVMSESDHVRVSRNMESKTYKNAKQTFKGPQDKVDGKVRKTRELKKPSLSKKESKPALSEHRFTSNHKRGMKFGGGKKKNGSNNDSKGASRS